MAKLYFNNKVLVWPDVKFNDSHWIIYVQIYKNKKPVEIKQEWLKTDMPAGLTAVYSTLSWKNGSKPSAGKYETKIRHGKQGRNVLQQAISEVESKYKKQKLKHTDYSPTSTNNSPKNTNNSPKNTNNTNKKIPPALLRVFDDYPITYFEDMDEDFYCQRKYDGTRCLAIYSAGQVELYSRRLHDYFVADISADLLPILSKNKSIMLDGELYIHNTPLQTISGIVRGSDDSAKKKLVYVVFDFFDKDRPNMKFSERYEKLKDIIPAGKPKGLQTNESKKILLAPTYKLGKTRPMHKFLDKMNEKYKDFLAEGYEGMVLRRDLPYEPGFHEKHTDAIFKHKPIRTKEYKIIDYTDGRGKDKNKLIWICETADRQKFSVRPKMSADKREEMYKKFKNSPAEFNKVKGKMLTIEYNNLSIDGLPQQPRAILIRDYE